MSDFLEPWYLALRSPAGYQFRVVGSMDLAKSRLYAARAEALDTNLASLSVIVSPTTSDELWIVHHAEKKNAPRREESYNELPPLEL